MLFCSGKHEDKCDIYDFGVILLEIILGRTIKTTNDAEAFKDLVITGTLIHFPRAIFISFDF
jgi:hypothetical protein